MQNTRIEYSSRMPGLAALGSRDRKAQCPRTNTTAFASALLISTFAATPSLAAPASIKGLAVSIARITGTCPATIPVVVGVTRYEGGAVFDVTAQTLSAAYASKLLSATPQRIAFDADLRPAYASCEGSGRSKDGLYRFALHRGKLTYVVVPGKGPAGTVPGLLDVGVNGTPHVKMAFAD